MQGCLWHSCVRYPFDQSKFLTESGLEWFERRIGPYLPGTQMLGVPPLFGRLGQVCDGGGKRRIFSIGNYINQRLLAPVHDFLAKV